jgi:hypothetical protein
MNRWVPTSEGDINRTGWDDDEVKLIGCPKISTKNVVEIHLLMVTLRCEPVQDRYEMMD